jgi:hypothetical protein
LGTEFEFENALSAHCQRGVPDLLVYRKSSEPVAMLDKRVMERLAQKEALDHFIEKWFQGADGSLTAPFHNFENPAQFEELLERHLRKLIQGRIPALSAAAIAEPVVPLWTRWIDI